MIQNKAVTFILIIAIVSLLTGCERLTASLDGLGKEEVIETAPESVPEVAVAPELPEASEDSSDDLTGNVVAEVAEEPKSTTYTVKMTADGFSPAKLYIKAGDTVIWKNTRYGVVNKAMIIGVRECSKVRSGFLKSGESFTWTFDTPMTCTIADGVMTTKESKVFVE